MVNPHHQAVSKTCFAIIKYFVNAMMPNKRDKRCATPLDSSVSFLQCHGKRDDGWLMSKAEALAVCACRSSRRILATRSTPSTPQCMTTSSSAQRRCRDRSPQHYSSRETLSATPAVLRGSFRSCIVLKLYASLHPV